MAIVELSHSGTIFATIDDPQGSITLDTKGKKVTDYIKVQANGSKNVQHVNDGGDATSTSYVAKGSAITVAKTGTYKCTWFGYASSSSSSYYLSQLYVNGSAKGSTHTAAAVGTTSPIFTETLSLNQGDVIQIRARGRSTSYHHQVGLLTIEEQ